MKRTLFSGAALLAILCAVVSQNNNRCPGPLAVRKEIGSLSQAELTTLQITYNLMNRLGWWSWFSFLHIKFYKYLHGTPEFLPWHRRYIREVELTVQYYEPSFALPYFDAAAVCSDPASSVIFNSGYFGGNGGVDGCVATGFQSNWTMLFPNNSCLKRNFDNDGSINSWYCPESVTSDIQTSKSFADISYNIELGLHASVHNGIGGDMLNHQSPNDMIFFLHHSNIDRLWLKWQNINPLNRYNYTDYDGKPADINASMTVFSDPVIDAFDVGYGLNCYSYDDINPEPRDSPKVSLVKRKIIYVYKRSDLFSGSSAIQDISSIPDMSLPTALDKDALKEFFPLLAANGTSPAAVILPDLVTHKAVEYAKLWKQGQVGAKTGQTPAPITANSVQGSVTDISNHVSAGVADSTGDGAADTIRKAYKYPVPTRLSNEYLNAMNYDITAYEKFYKKQIALVDALNSNGYVSPYV